MSVWSACAKSSPRKQLQLAKATQLEPSKYQKNHKHIPFKTSHERKILSEFVSDAEN